MFFFSTAAPSAKPRSQRGHSNIVGGEPASQGEIPYQISFQSVGVLGAFSFCGGSVYSESVMITAAHCVAGEDFDDPDSLQVRTYEIVLKQILGHFDW